jgi:hypothetical protein
VAATAVVAMVVAEAPVAVVTAVVAMAVAETAVEVTEAVAMAVAETGVEVRVAEAVVVAVEPTAAAGPRSGRRWTTSPQARATRSPLHQSPARRSRSPPVHRR